MTNKIRNVTKQLLGAEDFIFNQGKQLQQRGSQIIEVNSVDFAVSVETAEDLNSLDTERYLKASLGHKKFVAVNGKYQETTDFTSILFVEGAELSEDFPVCRNGQAVSRWIGEFPKILTADDSSLTGPGWQVIVEGFNFNSGWFPVAGSFTDGGTIAARNQVLFNDEDSSFYSWSGTLPKAVPVASTPASTGGISANAWVNRGDAALASALAAGTAYVGGGKATVTVNSIKSLGSISSPQPDVTYNVTGFYANATVGGGGFIWDATRPYSDHNGGTIIAPPAIAAWDGTQADIASILNWTPTGGVGCWQRLDKGFVTPDDFGAQVGAFDSLATNKASLASKQQNVTLVINNPLILESDTYFYGDVNFNAKVATRFSAKIIFERNNTGVVLTPSAGDLAEFVRGSAYVPTPGLVSGATLILSSTEILVKRFGFDLPYYKHDAFEVVDGVAGVVQPAFDCTYTDLSKLTVTMYAPEEKTTVKGLNWLDSTDDNTNGTVVLVNRSNITFESINARAVFNKLKLRQFMYINNCINVTIKDSEINDFLHVSNPATGEWWGYGVNLFNTANITFENTKSVGCKHGITGRHDKNTKVKGGFYRTGALGNAPLDSHWTNDFSVNGAEIYCRNHEALTYSGSNVSLTNCKLRDCAIPIGVRSDVPFAGGSAIVSDNEVQTRIRPQCALWGYVGGGADYGSFFEQQVWAPTLLSIENNKIKNRTSDFHLENLGFIEPLNYENSNFQNIERIVIKGNKVVEGLDIWGLTNQNRPLIIQNSNQMKSIKIEDTDFFYNFRTAFVVNNLLASPSLLKVKVQNCTGFSTRVSIDFCSSFEIDKTEIRYLSGYGVGVVTKTSSFFYSISNSIFGRVANTSNKFKLTTSEIASDYEFVADLNGNTNVNISSAKEAGVVGMGNWSKLGNNITRIPYLDGYVNQSEFMSFSGVTLSSVNFNSATLPTGCIGIQTTTGDLQVNVGGVVKKATLAFL